VTMFIVAAIQHVKVGDLTLHSSSLSYASDDDDDMCFDQSHIQDYGVDAPTLSREEERSLVRDSTASFAGHTLSSCGFIITSDSRFC
jgi:proteasome activator subunit 4